MTPSNPPDQDENEPEQDFDENNAGGRTPDDVSQSLDNLREVTERLGAGLPANDHLNDEHDKRPKGKAAAESKDLPLLNPQLSLRLEKQAAAALAQGEGRQETVPEKTETSAAPPEETPPAPPPRFQRAGEILQKARLEGGYSIENVADEVKIKPQYLLAIEEGRASDLPSRAHAIGFVRVYASALGLDAAALAERFRAEAGSLIPVPPPPLPMAEPGAEKKLPGTLLVVVALVAALVLYLVGANSLRSPAKLAPLRPVLVEAAHPPPPPPVEQKDAPAPAPTAAPPPVAAPSAVTISAPASPEASPTSTFPPDSTAPGNARPDAADEEAPTAPNEEPVNTTPPPLQVATSRIRLEALEDASVQIFDAEGGLIAERNIRAGEVFYVPDKSGYTLATGNAGAVRLQVDGRNMPPLGDEDEAMHNIPLNPVLLLKYLQ